MADAKRDNNYITTLLGVSNVDGITPVVIYVDPVTHRILISTSESGSDSCGDGVRTVAVAGTAVLLSLTSIPCKRVWIQAMDTNTGIIAVGTSTVTITSGSIRGKYLFATQGDWFSISDLSLLYINASVAGEKVTYYYET
jgi:hypothetical protein